MILDSFSEINANSCPGAFQELNGLTIVVQNEDVGTTISSTPPPPFSTPPQSFPSLALPAEQEYIQGEDILLRALQSPFQSLPRSGLDQVNSNDVLRYLNLAPAESDAETHSKFSAESCSSREPPVARVAHTPSAGEKQLSHSDVHGVSKVAAQSVAPRVGSKRKARSSGSSAKRCKLTQTSRFCHVCVRSSEQVSLVPCSNVIGAICRKATCRKCFDKHELRHEWEDASRNAELIKQVQCGELEKLPDKSWTCLHCRSICPATAQCKIYARTNKRRHLVLKQRKAEKDRLLAQRDQTQFRDAQGSFISAAGVHVGNSSHAHGRAVARAGLRVQETGRPHKFPGTPAAQAYGPHASEVYIARKQAGATQDGSWSHRAAGPLPPKTPEASMLGMPITPPKVAVTPAAFAEFFRQQ